MTYRRMIVICDQDYFPLVLEHRRLHPSLNLKLIDKEDLADMLSLSFDESPIPWMLGDDLDYVTAKKWLRILRFGEYEKNAKAKEILSRIPAERIRKDPLGMYELSHADVVLLEMQEDREAHGLLTRANIAFRDLTLEEFGIAYDKAPSKRRVIQLCQNKFEQFFRLFSSLRKGAVKGSLPPEKVLIHIKDDNDVFFLTSLGGLFGMPVRYKRRTTLFDSPKVSALSALIHQRGNFVLTDEEKTSEEGKLIQAIIDEFQLLKKTKFTLAYSTLVEVLRLRGEAYAPLETGVDASSGFAFAPGKRVYITDFQHGDFHAVYADDDVLSDSELIALGLNASFDRTSLDARKKRNYILYNNVVLFSRVKEHLDEKIYASQFEEDMPFKVKECLFLNYTKGYYTEEAAKLFHIRELDKAFIHQPVDEYRSYDSRFKGIKGFKRKKTNWSVTNLESYVKCPYRYYLKEMLPQADFDLTRKHIGVMFHKALEGVYEPNFDADAALTLAKQAFLDDLKDCNETLTPQYEMTLELATQAIRRYLPYIRDQVNHAKILKSFSEKHVKWELKDEDGQSYAFTGFIDSLLVVGEGAFKYYVIQDFKTGAEKFRPYEAFLGSSTQLPLYYYALANSSFPGDEQAVFGGMGIKTVGFSRLTDSFAPSSREKPKYDFNTANVYNALAVRGVFLADPSFYAFFDDTAKDKKSGEPTSSGLFFKAGDYVFDGSGHGNVSMRSNVIYPLPELVKEAIAATLETIAKIQAGEFPIAPTPSNLVASFGKEYNACSYCPYANVCYRDIGRDKHETAGEIRAHFKDRLLPQENNKEEEE